MKKYCKNIDITDRSLIQKATYDCLADKYTRNDVLILFASISGMKKSEIYAIHQMHGRVMLRGHVELLVNIIRKELLNKNITFPDIWYMDKEDNSSRKLRHIGIQNVKQQIYDYIAVEGLRPLLRRIGEHQMASIRGRGQTVGVRKIRRWLRNRSINYYAKMDIRKCYPSIDKLKLMQFLERHIKNDMLLWLIDKLIHTFEEGLSIGSYLSQFLCNLYLSQIYHFIGHLHKQRKSRSNGNITRIPLVHHRLMFMDDILLLGTSLKDVRKAANEIIKYCETELGLTIKSGWFIQKLTVNRANEFIDMMGFRMYRNRTTIRRRVFKRIRRLAIRMYRNIKTHVKINVSNARTALSYWGVLKNSDSYMFIKKYHIEEINKVCKEVIRSYDKGKICRGAITC